MKEKESVREKEISSLQSFLFCVLSIFLSLSLFFSFLRITNTCTLVAHHHHHRHHAERSEKKREKKRICIWYIYRILNDIYITYNFYIHMWLNKSIKKPEKDFTSLICLYVLMRSTLSFRRGASVGSR